MICRTLWQVVGLLFVQVALYGRAQTDSKMDVRLRPVREEFELGQPIELSLEFANRAHTPFYLKRTYDFGPKAIDLVASRGPCEYRIRPSHGDMLTSERRLMYTRMLERDRLIQDLPEINYPKFADLVLPDPGTYTLYATFRSEGPETVGSQRPVWRGFVRSPEIRIVITAPAPDNVERMRAALRMSLQTGDTDLGPLTYFQLVKDSEAAKLLVASLATSAINPFLLDAIAHQNRVEDAPALEKAAASALLLKDAKTGDYAKALASRLRNPNRCD